MKFRFAYTALLMMLTVLFYSCSDELTSIQMKSFTKFYGSYLNDAGMDVHTLSNGGFAITGSIVPDSIPRMVLIRTDDAGNQVEGSPTVYGGDFQSAGHCLLELENGFLLGGTLTDTTEDDELHTDMFLVRADAAGQEIWSRRYGNAEDDILHHIVRRHTGGFVLAGMKTTNEDQDVWILMVDENGEPLFEFTGAAFDDDDEANVLLRTESGYLCGATYDEGAFEGTDFFIISLDENCNIIDTKALGTEDDDFVRSIIPYKDGYLLMGFTENTTTGNKEVSLYSFTLGNNLIGNVDKIATISAAGTDFTGEDCLINANDEIVIFGTREANENRDIWLLRLDSDGIIINEDENPVIFGQLGNQSGKAIDNTYDGGLIMTGSNNIEGNSVITLIKTDAKGGL